MQNPSRRDVVKVAGAAGAAAALTRIQGAPAIVKAASEQVKYGVIGTGGRGGYLLKHLTKVDNGRCAAVSNVDSKKMDQVALVIGTNPHTDRHCRLDLRVHAGMGDRHRRSRYLARWPRRLR